MNEGQVSVIIRYHQGAGIHWLKDALFSVAIQTHRNFEIVLALHNCTDETIKEINHFISFLPIPNTKTKGPCVKTFNTLSTEDIRSKQINTGITVSSGQYICFLDYDDVLYQHAFALHIESLRETGATINFAGCRKALITTKIGSMSYTKSKMPFLEREITIFDELFENHFPIHSYMINRKKIEKNDMFFDQSYSALEDYEFILRTISNYEFSTKDLNIPVAEYRIRDDQTHTTPFHDPNLQLTDPKWVDGRYKISELKKRLLLKHSISALLKMGGPKCFTP